MNQPTLSPSLTKPSEERKQNLQVVERIVGQFAQERGLLYSCYNLFPEFEPGCTIKWEVANGAITTRSGAKEYEFRITVTMLDSSTIYLDFCCVRYPESKAFFSYTTSILNFDDEKRLTAYLERAYEKMLALTSSQPRLRRELEALGLVGIMEVERETRDGIRLTFRRTA